LGAGDATGRHREMPDGESVEGPWECAGFYCLSAADVNIRGERRGANPISAFADEYGMTTRGYTNTVRTGAGAELRRGEGSLSRQVAPEGRRQSKPYWTKNPIDYAAVLRSRKP